MLFVSQSRSGGGTSGSVTLNNTGVTSNVAGAGISVSGATGAVTISNSITNNNQLTNGEGYTTNTGTTTASNSQTFTNKGGNVSQWTNDSGYTTNTGDITGVTAGTLLDGGGTSGTVTLNVDLSELSTSTTNGDGDYFVVTDTSSAVILSKGIAILASAFCFGLYFSNGILLLLLVYLLRIVFPLLLQLFSCEL